MDKRMAVWAENYFILNSIGTTIGSLSYMMLLYCIREPTNITKAFQG